jgi:hypothetical protein
VVVVRWQGNPAEHLDFLDFFAPLFLSKKKKSGISKTN